MFMLIELWRHAKPGLFGRVRQTGKSDRQRIISKHYLTVIRALD
jgi:hypothetical protein